ILFAFNHEDRALDRNRFVDLIFAIEHVRVGATGAPLPAVADTVTNAEARLVPFGIADLLKSGVVVGRGEFAVFAVAVALLWSSPAAVMAHPDRALAVDLDAQARRLLVCLRAHVGALRS